LAVLGAGHTPDAEAYRILRTNLQFTQVGRPLRSLLVTSALPGEGKSLTAANLAAAMAQVGKRVVLVDGDLHRPCLHSMFGLPNQLGLTTALLDRDGTLDVNTLPQETAVPGLRVLTSGPLPPNPAELLGSDRTGCVLAGLLAHADLLVLDSPPATSLTDAEILGAQVDGVLLVVLAGLTSRAAVRCALDALAQVHAHVVGTVLNCMRPSRTAGYFYYHDLSQEYGARSRKTYGKRRQDAGLQRSDQASVVS
jgi:non-specific protein-tyrosine kinase